MAVLGLAAIALDVPDIAAGIDFYRSAGLDAERRGNLARFRVAGQAHDCLVLRGSAPAKRLDHVRLFADDLDAIAGLVPGLGGTLIAPPPGEDPDGLWVRDPHGTLFHLLDQAPPPKSAQTEADHALPQRLGHVMLFSPDVMRSAAFLTEAFGMRLSDHAEDIAAFCCTQRDSDHHVIAFVKSRAIGFHHCSFAVADLDAVGRAGHALAQASGRDAWGLGRHGIGDNFFHYIQDPWGSWFEYFSDVRHIDDFSDWQPGNHPPETALAAWGPRPPESFRINPEIAVR